MPSPAESSRERQVLLSSLEAQRGHVLGILEGLPGEALHRRVLPSGWTCLGLVRHLALDVERFWFRSIVAGEQVELYQGAEAWQVSEDTPPEEVFALYRQEIDDANAVIARTPLDTPPARWPEQWQEWRAADLREIMLHVITETACHAGHLDAVRELIDGRKWVVVTDR
ncbi:MAG: DinB family protein [Gemmatimonadota bacterium]